MTVDSVFSSKQTFNVKHKRTSFSGIIKNMTTKSYGKFQCASMMRKGKYMTLAFSHYTGVRLASHCIEHNSMMMGSSELHSFKRSCYILPEQNLMGHSSIQSAAASFETMQFASFEKFHKKSLVEAYYV